MNKTPYEITFFGPVSIRSDSASLVVTDRKAMLLAFLLALRGTCSRHQLGSLLWPNSASERALASLRVRIHKINKEFPGIIVSNSSSVHLDPSVTHDIDFLSSDRQIPAQTALQAHRGHLLSSLDFPDLPQINVIVRHCRQKTASLACSFLYSQVMNCLESKQYPQAVYFLHQILLTSPHNETACRHLMRVHVLSGRRAAAIEAYESFRAGMREALGIEPDAKTRRLHLEILMLQNEDENYLERMNMDLNSIIN
ncbi:MAG: bacterial transcriptional activator domain-containing protein [Patescibacteria group bacterium]|nr:bacterial transcriptional activator domain-containing protein [Patescibacteria group bacterium]